MEIKKVLIIILAMISSSFSAPTGLLGPIVTLPIFQIKNELSDYESQKFYEHIETRLPNYHKYFKIYSVKYQVPWTLIAAVAYQESKWNDEAVSYTGVKGLMQLTSKTAQYLGIEDREDPHQSIRGGAYYLKYLYDKTPSNLPSAKRWTLALTAYNIGWGHLSDARSLAKRLKKNPNKWSDLKTVLPLLEDTKFYTELNYGFARGNETVGFVNKVFDYYNLLNSVYNQKIQLASSI